MSKNNVNYFTNTTDYFIYEYDGEDTFYGLVRSNIFSEEKNT